MLVGYKESWNEQITCYRHDILSLSSHKHVIFIPLCSELNKRQIVLPFNSENRSINNL